MYFYQDGDMEDKLYLENIEEYVYDLNKIVRVNKINIISFPATTGDV